MQGNAPIRYTGATPLSLKLKISHKQLVLVATPVSTGVYLFLAKSPISLYSIDTRPTSDVVLLTKFVLQTLYFLWNENIH